VIHQGNFASVDYGIFLPAPVIYPDSLEIIAFLPLIRRLDLPCRVDGGKT
jgi:hypothetical protein